jgi:hypothetical protein
MYKILLSAYEDILIYLNGDYDDEYILYCDSIREKIEALLQDYAITTKMSGEEILHVLEELQANSPMVSYMICTKRLKTIVMIMMIIMTMNNLICLKIYYKIINV